VGSQRLTWLLLGEWLVQALGAVHYSEMEEMSGLNCVPQVWLKSGKISRTPTHSIGILLAALVLRVRPSRGDLSGNFLTPPEQSELLPHAHRGPSSRGCAHIVGNLKLEIISR
jgi:hypothetical protein